ncbi:MAG: hypothetical protein BroJett018_25150 [Chloroflexota bacterium]|nr:MAG: hypothetical protein BroJett018_25150 [Chloroflexota bacterium]
MICPYCHRRIKTSQLQTVIGDDNEIMNQCPYCGEWSYEYEMSDEDDELEEEGLGWDEEDEADDDLFDDFDDDEEFDDDDDLDDDDF